MHMSSSRSPRLAVAGFTLVELLVTVLIVSVGMLGLVKMEAAGVSESQVSRVRSLMTFQAESLAGMMRADRGYWASSTVAGPTYTYDGTSFTPSLGTLVDCTTTFCTPANMAKSDLSAWATGFQTAFPGATASITCVTPTAAACAVGSSIPTTYDIKLTWSEKTVAVNRAGTAGAGNFSLVLHVQP
jgi:type IV pilus assembly protein PilV